jgi:hypothetical protein
MATDAREGEVIVVAVRPRVLVIGLVGGLILAIAVTAWLSYTAPPKGDWRGDRGELATVAARSATGSQVTLTDNLTQHRATVRLGDADTGLILDPMDLVCHGGRASITWAVGNLEPIVADTGSTYRQGSTGPSSARSCAGPPLACGTTHLSS